MLIPNLPDSNMDIFHHYAMNVYFSAAFYVLCPQHLCSSCLVVFVAGNIWSSVPCCPFHVWGFKSPAQAPWWTNKSRNDQQKQWEVRDIGGEQ